METRNSENLVDYFFVCGLDYNVGLDTYELSTESNEYSSPHCIPPLGRPYMPSILQHFPDHCGNYAFPEDYSITSLCMPDGLRLFTTSTVPQSPVNHNFIVTREDATRIYGTSLLFAEEIENEEIKTGVIDLQSMYKIAHNSENGGVHGCSECTSTSPETPNGSARDSGWYSYSNISVTGLCGSFWSEDEKLYTIKAIGVLSQQPYIHCFQSWLYDIWLMVSNENNVKFTRQLSVESSSDVSIENDETNLEVESKVNLESYVFNILFETDAPARGESIVIDGPSMRHFCQCPDPKDLPVFELPMRDLLEVLGLESLIRIYSCVLLEYRVVILSQDYRLLMLVAECITCLLFPFVWSHVYAPILPLAARHFLNAPVPFIMGIKLNSSDEEDAIQLPSDACVCYVNIDKQTVKSSDDIPIFPYEMNLRKEITELLVGSINHGNITTRPFSGRRGFCGPIINSNIQQVSELESKNSINQLPPKINLKGYDNFKTLMNENVTIDNLVDIPLPIEKIRRGSHITGSSIMDGKLFFNSYRLPSDPGKSLSEITAGNLVNEDGTIVPADIAKIYYKMLNFNTVLRELFLNHFLHIFNDYKQFIIPPKDNINMSAYFLERDSTVQPFDKAGFLSEQPETHLPFLSAFLETQMFTYFVEMKIVDKWEDPHPNLVLFEQKLQKRQDKYKRLSKGQNSEILDIRSYRSYPNSKIMENLEKDLVVKLDKLVTQEPKVGPHILDCNNPEIGTCLSQSRSRFCGQHHHHHNKNKYLSNQKAFNCTIGTNFPTLQGDCLRSQPRKKSTSKHLDKRSHIENEERLPVKFRQKSRTVTETSDISTSCKSYTLGYNGELNSQKEKYLAEKHLTLWKTRTKIDPKPYLPNIIPMGMAQNHWAFVNKLLQECKTKTKRMVLEKMGGKEAIELGHGDLFVSGIEENTLVAGLCDLLERIWCHGLTNKYGKSALWTHLTKYVDRDRKKNIIKRPNIEIPRRGSVTAGKSPSNTELVKEALTGVGVDSYCLFRYFNDSKGDLHHGDVFGSLKQMKLSSHQSERSKTPDFINKTLMNSGHGVSELFFNWNQNLTGSLGRSGGISINTGSSKSIDLESIFGPHRRSLVADVNAIKSMTDIITDVGLARAFVRLALEKKLLSEHLKKLLMDTLLLKELYKRHAFLRCEEEREQFLFHLLALQAVEYYSFTNLYIKIQLVYRVFIYSGKRFSTGTSTTANAWFCVNGQHCSTGQRAIPKGLYQFEFENPNLGVLTSLRIGHDNSGMSPKWFIDFVLIQNLITGLVYKFPCNNWLGKGVDDSSTERLLVGEIIRLNEDDMNEIMINNPDGVDISFFSEENDVPNSSVLYGFQTPPRSRSPSASRRQSADKIQSEVAMIQEQLGNAVNNLVKYFYRQQERDKLVGNNISASCNVTLLLCGADGLVPSMEKVFRFGFKSSRLFQKKFYVWDYLEKTSSEFSQDLNSQNNSLNDPNEKKYSPNQCMTIQYFCKLISKIAHVNQSIGKDGKFQRFVSLSIRDHKLPELIGLLGQVDCTQQYYEESCFFRDNHLRDFLIKILLSLNDFVIPLERALTDGL